MFTVVITEKGGAQRRMDFDKNEVTIGRVQGNDIILPKGNVSKRHSRIVLKDNRFIVVDLKSTNGTYVNGRKITSPLVVKPGDKIYIGDFILTVDENAGAGVGSEGAVSSPAAAPSGRQSAPPPAPSRAAPPAASAPPPPVPAARPPEDAPPPPRRPAPMRSTRPPAPRPPSAKGAPAGVGPMETALRTVMYELSKRFDVTAIDASSMDDAARWEDARARVSEVVGAAKLPDGVTADAVSEAALKEAVGLGVIDTLLANDAVREIVVEGPFKVLADYGEGLVAAEHGFSSTEALVIVARRIAHSGGDKNQGRDVCFEVALPSGTHVQCVMPPVAVRGPVIEIRRASRGLTADALAERGALSPDMLDLLREAAEARLNILVAGAVGSGVTTLLGALVGLCDNKDRVLTVEDVPDLHIDRPHTIALSTGTANRGIGMEALLRQAGKLRTDRLVVDDIRGPEVKEALTLFAARRNGNLLGLHCPPKCDALAHLFTLLRLSGRGSDDAMINLVTSSVRLLVEVSQDDEGNQRISRIAEIMSTGGGIEPRDIFVLQGGRFVATNHQPSFR